MYLYGLQLKVASGQLDSTSASTSFFSRMIRFRCSSVAGHGWWHGRHHIAALAIEQIHRYITGGHFDLMCGNNTARFRLSTERALLRCHCVHHCILFAAGLAICCQCYIGGNAVRFWRRANGEINRSCRSNRVRGRSNSRSGSWWSSPNCNILLGQLFLNILNPAPAMLLSSSASFGQL